MNSPGQIPIHVSEEVAQGTAIARWIVDPTIDRHLLLSMGRHLSQGAATAISRPV